MPQPDTPPPRTASDSSDDENYVPARVPCERAVRDTPDAGTLSLSEEADNFGASFDFVAPTTSDVPHPRTIWHQLPSRMIPDEYGYGRIPAFWFTLNLPFNYLFEIHRFQQAVHELQGLDDEGTTTDCLDPIARDAMTARCSWVLDNPDIVVLLHAIRVELLVNYVMRDIVPTEEDDPFLYWLRFEFGSSGNPHAHGVAYVAGNPQFDMIVKDAATKKALLLQHLPEAEDIRTWEELSLIHI